jgi:hypothetical protein
VGTTLQLPPQRANDRKKRAKTLPSLHMEVESFITVPNKTQHRERIQCVPCKQLQTAISSYHWTANSVRIVNTEVTPQNFSLLSRKYSSWSLQQYQNFLFPTCLCIEVIEYILIVLTFAFELIT